MISIHVPAWGTTPTIHCFFRFTAFQSTFPRGERPMVALNIALNTNFNPRSRVGNDFLYLIWYHVNMVFQSTFPRGERLTWHLMEVLQREFQSTFPRGERRWNHGSCRKICISIHVPAWGTTDPDGSVVPSVSISIHVPAWGTTDKKERMITSETISIHVPAWGTTA